MTLLSQTRTAHRSLVPATSVLATWNVSLSSCLGENEALMDSMSSVSNRHNIRHSRRYYTLQFSYHPSSKNAMKMNFDFFYNEFEI